MSRLERALRAFGARPGANARTMATGGAMLYAPGGAIVLATLLLPRSSSTPPVIAGVAVAALLVAALLVAAGERLSPHAYPLLTALGTALITLLVHVGGTAGRGYALLYVWAVLYAFYFYRPWQAALQALLVAVGALACGNLGLAPEIEFLMIVTTVVVAGSWMRRSVQDLLASEETFRRMFADNPQPMWVYEIATLRFLAVNRAAVEHYGWTEEEFRTMRLTDIRPEEDCELLLEAVANHREGDTSSPTWRHRLRDGRIITVEVRAHDQVFDGRPARLTLVSDVTERVELERQLRHRALHDPLTGLANRALFGDRLAHALARRHAGRTAVLIVDLDGFKGINDTVGHGVGDEVLVTAARRLDSALRAGDTAAHIGGDEFAVVLEDLEGPEIALAVAERILAAIRPAVRVSSGEVFVTASLGLAIAREGDSAERILQNADLAMYSAKQAGRDRVEVYAPAMHAQLQRRLALASDLHGAVERRELEVHYQPMIDLGSDRVLGVEALVRWRHPARGLLAPGEFIPIAEESGLIVPIGAWVLETAAHQVRAWQEHLPGVADLELAVNVSARQLRDESFVDVVSAVVERTGLARRDLVLEVTETVLVDDLESTSELLRRLRAAGHRVALDDFGAGYSSLGYLRGLPLDVVKIDRMFVTGLGADVGANDDRELTLAIVRLIDTLDVRTVAEGIETERQLDYVRALGIDAGQGFHFSRPVPAADVPALLSRFSLAPSEQVAVS